MKLGIIRCMQTEDYCPGTSDFKTIQKKVGAFSGVSEPIELIGFVSCGGCPGKRAVLRAKELVKRGADTIAFASCIKKGTPIGFPCPMAEPMMQAVKKAVGEEIKILDYTLKLLLKRHAKKSPYMDSCCISHSYMGFSYFYRASFSICM